MHTPANTKNTIDVAGAQCLSAEPDAAVRKSDELFRQLSRNFDELRQTLAADSPAVDHALRSKFQDTIEACATLADRLGNAADDLQQELAQVEWLNHELRLQLQARSSESNKYGLTGLANRRAFDREFGERCVTAQNTQCPLLLVILDIDHFKSINDSRGHHVGDTVLRGLAGILADLVPPGAFLARYGGEEFAIVLSGICVDDAIDTVEQLRCHIRRTQFRYEGQAIAVTISCGLAQLLAQDHSEHLLARSDAALYASKQAGRNRTSWHDGQDLHLVTPDTQADAAQQPDELTAVADNVVDLDSADDLRKNTQPESGVLANLVTTPRTTRANWCDGSMLFWYIRQRLAEWKRGGDPMCILAIDVDHGRRIAQTYGLVALHFMMRTQMLHLDTTLRETEIVARTSHSRVIVVLPRKTLSSLVPLLQRLHDTMDRFAYPVVSGTLEYSISIGVAESSPHDDAQQLVLRAEAALIEAQLHGKKQFYFNDSVRSRKLEIYRAERS
jgi:diguanylate cyclase